MARSTGPVSKLRKLRAKLGTAELARRMGIPAPSVRRMLSTDRVSAEMRLRLEAVRSAYRIPTAQPKPRPPKRKKSAAEELRELKAELRARARKNRERAKKAAVTRRKNLAQLPLDERIDRLRKLKREVHEFELYNLAKDYSVEARYVFTLYKSPGFKKGYAA